MEVIDIKDVSLEWYKDWWYANKDDLYKKKIRHILNCRYGNNITLEFYIGDRENVILIITTNQDPNILGDAFEYLDSHSIMEFFRDWNDDKRNRRRKIQVVRRVQQRLIKQQL